MSRYTIGIDFGTLSARAIVVDVDSGDIPGAATMDYPHGVLDERLPDGTPLPPDWALQHPGDYLECLRRVVPEAMRRAGVPASDIAGLGIDFTACTSLPVNAENEPLCLTPAFEHIPQAWVMLWKHHGAQSQAERMTAIARERGEAFLRRYGGRISSEWLFPKLWQILEEAPEVYAAAHRFTDAGDWVVSRLTGAFRPSACIAGYKGFWHAGEGYPSGDFFAALDPRLARAVPEKLDPSPCPIGSRAGGLTEAAAATLGLRPGTAVAVANMDAHAAVPGAGLSRSGDMLMIIGTSACYMLTSEEEREVPGICGVVRDGLLPGFYGYEAGQSCVGDLFGWQLERLMPADYARAAADAGLDAHAWMTRLASALRPGESGLIALDWWNGNRSVLVDAGLSGLLLGMTLATRPEDIYRALIEATAYGARVIVENYEAHGVPVRRLFASGGIARKNPLLMQIYADVLGREIHTAASDQASALGAAIFGALASGCFGDTETAVRHMTRPAAQVYRPEPEAVRIYDLLYGEYLRLHDRFGRGDDVMKRLKSLRNRQIHG